MYSFEAPWLKRLYKVEDTIEPIYRMSKQLYHRRRMNSKRQGHFWLEARQVLRDMHHGRNSHTYTHTCTRSPIHVMVPNSCLALFISPHYKYILTIKNPQTVVLATATVSKLLSPKPCYTNYQMSATLTQIDEHKCPELCLQVRRCSFSNWTSRAHLYISLSMAATHVFVHIHFYWAVLFWRSMTVLLSRELMVEKANYSGRRYTIWLIHWCALCFSNVVYALRLFRCYFSAYLKYFLAVFTSCLYIAYMCCILNNVGIT